VLWPLSLPSTGKSEEWRGLVIVNRGRSLIRSSWRRGANRDGSPVEMSVSNALGLFDMESGGPLNGAGVCMQFVFRGVCDYVK
jgi:hypothetical protein